jgi:hypothetical protein
MKSLQFVPKVTLKKVSQFIKLEMYGSGRDYEINAKILFMRN